MDLVAFVITYQRDPELRSTLQALAGQPLPPRRLLVVDNGRSSATRQVVAGFASSGSEYMEAPANLGPAGAAKLALAHLAEDSWDWVYWGDDDDPPRDVALLERLVDLAAAAPANSSPVGAVAESGLRWDWRHGRGRRLPDEELGGPVEVDAVGGGQQLLLHRDAVERVAPPDERLFFGLEDFDYCLRLRAAGFRILADGESMLVRRREAKRPGSGPGAAPVPRMTRDRLPRHYYSTRNYVFLMRETYARPDLVLREVLRVLARSATAWRRGPGFAIAFGRILILALWHGFHGRMGETLPLRPLSSAGSR